MERLAHLRGALYAAPRGETVALSLGDRPPLSSPAVRYDDEAAPALGARAPRRVRFELPLAGLPVPPAKGDRLTDALARAWRVIDVDLRPEVGAVLLTVERV